ncbi:tetrahydromethanopterin S-methyltransferase subunit C [Methanobrevibacter cuticularis]|uniref:Tetrahydromethanopterin S-methyltransferase subunit C n=1 Tax=Methanobrevibacter cuticularis TaxID=47311 RepID=A0A166F2K1_9EURY|nr:tetrahydromethanopterin S-methyltransferase subunit C [Methanobrevibacter cuticularis]KZX17250.1 tetrahydromethanopterin S-methyltransferase subunit C [Methanobrevibacter cuticularis]
MSVAGGGSSESAISPEKVLALGIIGGLIGIYLVSFNPVIGPVLAGLGAVCAIVWGVDAIRRVASYGLGTGVPSIGYMSLSIGIIGALAGIALVSTPILAGLGFLGPILALIFAVILGLLVALVAKKIVGMKIPVLVRCTAEISGAAALSVLGFSAALAGTYTIDGILASVVAPGFIALFFIMNTMAIQHPFNACLGPNENQVRTLKLGASTAFLAMVITGILTIINPVPNVWLGIPVWVAMIVVAMIGWIISIRAYINASYEEAASVKWSGLWPKVEEQ